MTTEEFENRARALVGRSVVEVRYYEIEYRDEKNQAIETPQWNGCSDFDSLDHGLELTLVDGATVYIVWGSEFLQYGVSIRSSCPLNLDAVRTWNVSRESRWRHLLGKPIIATEVFWERVRCRSWKPGAVASTEPSEPQPYPQDLALHFEDGARVYISALEIRADGHLQGMSDHITVFFGDGQAREFEVGPFAPRGGPPKADADSKAV